MPTNLYLLLPVAIPAFAAVALVLLAGFVRSQILMLVLSLGALLAAAFSTTVWSQDHTLFNEMLRVGPFTRLIALSCIGIGAFACCAAPGYSRRLAIGHEAEFYILVLSAVAGMIMMVSANDLMVLFVNLELLSLSVYILCGLNRRSLRSTESALKYFISGAATSAMLIFGIALMYGVTGTTLMTGIAAFASVNAPMAVRTLYLLACALICAAFFFKIGLFPFHAYLPDVYEGAPTSVTGFMAAGVRVAAAIAFMRIVILLFVPFAAQWSTIFWWGAVLSMCLGNFAALRQNNVKRMLAYSSIAHAGYLLIGFVGLSNVNLPGAEAVVYYLLMYAVVSLAIFAVVGQVETSGEKQLTFDSYRGLGLRQPLIGVLVSLLLLSLAGIPPLGGFWAKYAIFTTAIKNQYLGLALIGVLNSLVSVYYYFRLLVSMYMLDPEKTEGSVRYEGAPLATAAIAVCAFLLIWLGIGPVSIGQLIPSADKLWLIIEKSIAPLSSF